MTDKVKIVKVGESASPPPAPTKKAGRKFTAHKTYPRSAMKNTQKVKVKAVKDPARPPPRKSTLRVLTNKGLEQRRQNIRKTVKHMPSHRVRETLQKAGLPISNKTPDHIAREILEGGVEAGFIRQ